MKGPDVNILCLAESRRGRGQGVQYVAGIICNTYFFLCCVLLFSVINYKCTSYSQEIFLQKAAYMYMYVFAPIPL